LYTVWFAIIIAVSSQFIIFPLGSLNEQYAYQFTSTEQTDLDTDLAVPLESNGLLVAFFGLDSALPRRSNNFVPNSAGMDGMPVIFSKEIDLTTMQAGDFRVTTQSNTTGFVHGVTLAPAIDEGELRTVLLVGDYGDDPDDPPVLVEIIGNLYSMDGSVNFKNSSISVTPLADGPTIVFAEIVPESVWSKRMSKRADRDRYIGSGVPDMSNIANPVVIRLVWAGGVELENGRQLNDAYLDRFTVTLANGSTIHPFAFADLFDNDNNQLICLDTDVAPTSVAVEAGILVDPNHDLNPATSIVIS
jgi:hypothetical protein